MTDTVVTLKAAAVTLLVEGMPSGINRDLTRGHALATLIDGMLKRGDAALRDLQRAESAMLGEPERIGAAIWYQTAQCAYAEHKESLRLLAVYVNTVLGSTT